MTIHVAHVSSLCTGGAVAMLRTHRGLLQQGLDSRVYCSAPLPDDEMAATRVTPAAALPKRWGRVGRDGWSERIRQASKNNPAFEAFTPPVVPSPNHLDIAKPDVIHLHWAGGLVDFPSFFNNLSLPVIWTLHDQNPMLGGFHYQHDVDAAEAMLPLEYEARDIKRRALRKTSLTLIGNSRWSTEASRRSSIFPTTTDRKTCYLPISVDDFQPVAKRTAKVHQGLDPSRLTIGFAAMGIKNRRKGIADFIAALRKLPRPLAERTTVVSFGHLSRRDQVDLGPIQWCHLGHLQSPTEQSLAYAAMDMFVIASLEEAFGQTPVEALLCGTPVVGTDAGGIGETVVDGQTGLLVPSRDPDAMAAALLTMARDDSLRRRLAERGRQQCVLRHNSETVSRQMMSIYRDAIASFAQSRLPSTARAA